MKKLLSVLSFVFTIGLFISLSQTAHAGTIPSLGFTLYEGSVGSDVITSIESLPGYDRLYIASRDGTVVLYDQSDTSIVNGDYLDLPSSPLSFSASGGGEKGLLSIALDPDYVANGYLYIAYTDNASPFNLVIDRFQTDGEPNADIADIDTSSRLNIFTIEQPFSNHNGADLSFGPDGYLYVSIGDGGSQNDPNDYAQNTNNPYGKILRFDTDDLAGDGVPDSNPYRFSKGWKQIFEYGFRNPWRATFDSETGDYWVGDVGGGAREEIDLVNINDGGGQNYGWRCREGFIQNPNLPGCTPTSQTIDPIGDYTHGGGRCSVTGGEVYRGSAYPAMYGHYIFTDYCTGDTYSIVPDRQGGWDQTHQGDLTTENITTFGTDQDGELYAGTSSGDIYQVTAGSPAALPTSTPSNIFMAGVTPEWNTFEFNNSYSTPPILIADIFAEYGTDKVYLEIDNVTTTGFDARIRENTRTGDNNRHYIEEFLLYAFEESYDTGSEAVYGGKETVNSTWRRIAFDVPFSGTPYLQVTKTTANGSDLSFADVRNLSATGFDVRIQEPPGWDDTHTDEIVSWSAWENHDYFDEYGTVAVDHNWQTVNFGGSPNAIVGVMATIVSENGRQQVNTDIRNVTPTSFEIRLEEESTLDGMHNAETVHWASFSTGDISAFDSTSVIGDTWTQIPMPFLYLDTSSVFAEINSENGSDTVQVDIRNVTRAGFEARLEEDEMAGWDGKHTNETIAWFRTNDDFGRGDINYGTATIDSDWTQVNQSDILGSTPAIITTIQTENDPNTANVDLSNFVNDAIDMRIEEDPAAGWDNIHFAETVAYLAMDSDPDIAGSGTVDSLTLNDNDNWVTVNVSAQSFTETPRVFASVITENGGQTANVDIRNVTPTSFEIRLEEEPNVNNGLHTDETVTYWVFENIFESI